MTRTRRRALAALREADHIYRKADAHRTHLMALCKQLEIPREEVEKAIGIGVRSEDIDEGGER